jgi:hypothetical protein
VRSAINRVTLAGLQQERFQTQARTYAQWIQAGLNDYERAAIDAYQKIARLEVEGATGELFSSLIRRFGALGRGMAQDPLGETVKWFVESISDMREHDRQVKLINERARAQVSLVHASHERKEDEWELARQLAEQDAIIAGAQQLGALDEVRIQQQEQTIAETRAEHAEAILDFLSRKFTSFDLYDWMSAILERVYRFFLQQATATAQAASRQLAFERQEPLTRFIQPDYWLPPSTDSGGQTEDRRGLTGSARLSQDIYQLDQYAFQTNRQKQQLVKVISLSQLDPYAFEQLRSTGVMRFGTPMELFDRDFPGHYLRLIRRVRTSVIALIPPTHGIRAMLTGSGLSRVVVADGTDFRTLVVRREPESVALSSPLNATGLFELEPQSEMPFPFEWTGVDTAWELRLPKASNRFDYNTLVDVLLTVEYTTLDSPAYRREVMKRFSGRPLVADRPFSFRHELADAWYDLNNPDPAASAIAVTFDTRRQDFPANLEDLKIERVLLDFSYADGRSLVMQVDQLNFTPQGGATISGGPGVSDQRGLISSRSGGGASGWSQFRNKPVAGRWELILPNQEQVRDRFENQDIENMLFVITYSGRTPPWPQ